MSHSLEFHGPGWHDEAHTPIVEGKYYDRATGEVRVAAEGTYQEYMGPPSVDIVINSLHEDTVQCVYRAARAFPMRVLLCHIMKVVNEKELEIDSVIATRFAIRVTLSHALNKDEFYDTAANMVNGIWDAKE